MTDTLEDRADRFVQAHASEFNRLFSDFGRSLGNTKSVESDLRQQVETLQAQCSTLEDKVRTQESELSRAHEAHRREMQGITENQRRLVAEAERKQAQMVTQQITSQMQTQYERVRTEHAQSQQTIVRLQAELAQSRQENQTLTQTVQSLEVSQSAAAVQKVQSNLVGASQEEFLMSALMDTFPFARVEDCSRTPKNMDIRLTLPTKQGQPPCIIAIESKARKKSNVDSTEIEKFERDFAGMEDADGAILVARRRVDVLGGRSEELCRNLRRAGPNTMYVDNCCTEALVRACMLLYAHKLQPSSALALVSGEEGGPVNELQLEMVNEALRQASGYIRTQNDLIAQFYQPLRSHYLHHAVTADPLAASLVNLRNVLDGVQTEQVIHSLALKGSGGSVKKKRKLCNK